jgi:polyisoprenoid-binding protein YceI
MLILLVAAVAVTVGCKSEIDNKPAAEVSAPAAVKSAEKAAEGDKAAEKAESAEELTELAVAVEESSIGWVGAKVTGDHTGGFKTWEGTLYTKDGEVRKMEFTVDTTSIFSDTEKLTAHLKSADFFDVEKYPEAKFVSTKIVEKAAKGATHEVTGNFTIRGVTKQVTFPATIAKEGNAVKASTEFTIKRFDFGIMYKGKADDLIRDEVLLKISLVAPTEAAEPTVAEAAKAAKTAK